MYYIHGGKMKNAIIKSTMNSIKTYKNFDDKKLSEIKYGLEALYLTITKIVVIILISIPLGTIKELLYIFLFYGLLRITGFGAHTKTSLQCWIWSLTIFLLFPYLVKNIVIPKNIAIFLMCLLLILILVYAPADTEKRPLIHKKKRIIYKIICFVNTLIYIIISIFLSSNYFINIFLFSILIQVIMVLPITYKLLGIKYNNYKYYKRKEDSLNESIS